MSAPVTIVRSARRVLAPASVRCGLCKLNASDDESPPSVVHFEVRYNGDDGMPENPLCALTRRKYICDSCIVVVAATKPVEAKTPRVADTTDPEIAAAARRAIAAVARPYQTAALKTCPVCTRDPDPRGPSACAACRELNRKGPLFPDLSDAHVVRVERALFTSL
jgi:hypothetical protein